MTAKMQKNKNYPRSNFCIASNLLPQGKDVLPLLQSRAERLAQREITVIDKENIAYVRFRLGTGAHSEQYGIPYCYAKEVMRNTIPTPLPGTFPFIAGIINRRGALLTVLDLKQFFHTQLSPYDKESCVIIVTAGGITVGLLADSIEGSDCYDLATLDGPLSSGEAVKPEYIIGLHLGVTAIIHVEAMLSDPKLQMKK